MSWSSRRDPGADPGGIGSAPRAFLQLSAQGAELEDQEASAARRVIVCVLALLILIAVPLFWATGGSGDTPLAFASNSGSNSGPAGGDDDGDGEGR